MLQQITINGIFCFIYQQIDFNALLKCNKPIYEDDIPKIRELFDIEYNKYLSTCKK